MSSSKTKLRPLTDEEEARIQAGIAADPDNPELTDEELARMLPAREVLAPALYAALVNRGGRPPSEAPKVQLTLRLDRAVVGAFRATGPGWQTRMNEVLARAAEALPAQALPAQALPAQALPAQALPAQALPAEARPAAGAEPSTSRRR